MHSPAMFARIDRLVRLLLLAIALATVLPAWRAVRTDPLGITRDEY